MKKRTLKLFCSVTIIAMLVSIVSTTVFADTAVAVIQGPAAVNLNYAEVPVEKSQISVSGTTAYEIGASDNVHSSSGAVLMNGISTYNGSTVRDMYQTAPASNYFAGAYGVNASRLNKQPTFKELGGYSLTQIKALYEEYGGTTRQSAFSVRSFFANGSNESSPDYNPVEDMLDSTLEHVMFALSSNNEELFPLIDVANNATSMSQLVTDPLQSAGLSTALSATSGINLSEINDAPIGDVLTQSANRTAPKENGELYDSPLDVMIYQVNEEDNIEITPDTPVSEFMRQLVYADGEFAERTDKYAYPTVFWIKGNISDDAEYKMDVTWPDFDTLKDNLYIRYDSDVLTSDQYTLTEVPDPEDVDNTHSSLSVPNVFSKAGVHALSIVVYDQPMFILLDLQDPNAPVTNPDGSNDPTQEPPTTPTQPSETDPENDEEASTEQEQTSDNTFTATPDIPKTGHRLISGLSAACAVSAAFAGTAWIKAKRKKEK